MKRLNILLVFIALISFSCQEKMDPIIIVEPPTGDRVVLMEEFSGGSCVPCANAHSEIENLLAIYGHSLVVVTMHTFVGGQGNPVSGSTYDFRNQEGHDILDNLGWPEGIPSAVVNRKKYTDEVDLQLGLTSWAGYIASEVSQEPKLELDINTTFDASNRSLQIDVNILPRENISGDLRLTLMITENGIIDKQATPDGVVDDYVHNHILRDVISTTEGDVLGALNAFEAKVVNYNYTIPAADGSGPWIPENCQVVAFVSYIGQAGLAKDVLQAAEAKVVE